MEFRLSISTDEKVEECYLILDNHAPITSLKINKEDALRLLIKNKWVLKHDESESFKYKIYKHVGEPHLHLTLI